MKKTLFILLTFMILGCSKEPKTDSELLTKDKTDLAESLQSHKVTTYKFGKIMIRASVATDTISPEYQVFKSDLKKIAILVLNIGEKESYQWNVPMRYLKSQNDISH